MTSLIYFYLWKNSEPCKAYSDDKNHGFKMSKECAKVLEIFINEHHVELQQRLIQDLLSVSTLWYGGEVTTIFMKLPMVSREKNSLCADSGSPGKPLQCSNVHVPLLILFL